MISRTREKILFKMAYVRSWNPTPSWFSISSEESESINNYKKLTLEVTFNQMFRTMSESADPAYYECLSRWYAFADLMYYIHASKFHLRTITLVISFSDVVRQSFTFIKFVT